MKKYKYNVVCHNCGADNCRNNGTCIKCDYPLKSLEIPMKEFILNNGFEFDAVFGVFYRDTKKGRFTLLCEDGKFSMCDIDLYIQFDTNEYLVNVFEMLTGEKLIKE